MGRKRIGSRMHRIPTKAQRLFLDLHGVSVYSLCMGSKTISLEIDAYERLKAARLTHSRRTAGCMLFEWTEPNGSTRSTSC